MKSIIKRSLTVLVVALVLMQLWHPAKNGNTVINERDITRVYVVPDNVHEILERACYDCHSNNTRYPWYNKVQPVSWWMNDHVKEGKQHLNFSEFGTNGTKGRLKRFKEIANTVTENEMPLSSYTWEHKEAVLNNADKATLINWARTQAQQIADTMKN